MGCMQLGSKPGSCQANPADRSIVVQITDQCPECGADHMDLQALTWARVSNILMTPFNVYRVNGVILHAHLSVKMDCGQYQQILNHCIIVQIANPSPSGGRVNVQSRRVECAPPASITVSVTNNLGNNAWMRLQIMVGFWPRNKWCPKIISQHKVK